MRFSHVVLFVVLCAMGACVYHVANLYQTVERRSKKLDVAIERERENIRVLSAEWAYLTNPVRMEKLAQDYLYLQAMDGSQLVAVSGVPLRDHMNDTYPEAPARSTMAKTTPSFASSLKAVPVSTGASYE